MATMEIPCNQLPPGDPRLVDAIVGQLKSKGIFDKFRKECLADVDTKPAFLNLRQRVDGQVKKFLNTKTWRSDLNKNQLRDGVRKNIQESGILDTGIDAIINQVVNPKVKTFILPLVEDAVCNFLQIEKPKREFQEYDIPVQSVAVHHEEKSFYGQHMSLPQPCPPYHPVYQEYPPEFERNESINSMPKVASETDNNSINVEDSSISSESEISMDDKTEEDQRPAQVQPPITDILPMETDVISSGDDDILARASPDSSTSIHEKKIVEEEQEEEIKMEEDNAVDSFDSARREADAMTAAVESMTLRDEKLKTDSESQETPKETSVSLPLFDNKSLDSISSNTSGLSLSLTSPSKSTFKDSQSQPKECESPIKSLDEIRSTQSTPLVDEKSLNESISSENSKSWIPCSLPKDLPSAERVMIASFGSFGAVEPARVVEGASPVSVDDSQGSIEREELHSKGSKVSKSEKSEGEISSSSSSVSSTSDYPRDNPACSSDTKIKSEQVKESRSSDHKEEERSKDKEKHSSERRRSKDRDRRRSKSKSKHDDHYSHRKDKKHRRDRDDDKDRDRHSKGHHSSRTTSSGDVGSKDKDKSKDKSSDHKSHSSSHSKSHSKSHSGSHSKSHASSSYSRHHDKDHKSSKSSKRDDRPSSKSEKSSNEVRESTPLSKDVSSKSLDGKQKDKKNEIPKLKPVKLVEDNVFAMHLENNKKDAVLPKPVNSLKPLVPKVNKDSKVVSNNNSEIKTENKSNLNATTDSEDISSLKVFKESNIKDSSNDANIKNEMFKEEQENKDILTNVESDKKFNKDSVKDNADKNIKQNGKEKTLENGHINGMRKSLTKKMSKENMHASSGSSSESDSDLEDSKKSLSKLKLRLKRKERKISDSRSVSGSSSEEYEDRKVNGKKSTNITQADDGGLPKLKLKKVTIPLININSNDLKNLCLTDGTEQDDRTWIKPNKQNKKNNRKSKLSYTSETDSLFHELFGNSSDESENDFEGFETGYISDKSNSKPKVLHKGGKKLQKKKPKSAMRTMKINNNTINGVGESSMEVVLCDSGDSSDMEVSLVNFSNILESSSPEGPPKPNDFEGFDDEGFDASSSTGDQKLRDYLSQFSFGTTVQIDDFLSMDSEEEIGEESTVFFNKKNTTKSVIEEIAAKQKLNILNDNNNSISTFVVEASVHASDMESYKPFKKRKLSSISERDNGSSSPCKISRTVPDDREIELTTEPVPKNVVMNNYSMLTPEEDRISTKDYEVDLGTRESSYSPLSPASDSSSDAQLKHKNEAKSEELEPKSSRTAVEETS